LATFREKLKAKLPSRREVLPVFSVILFFIFSWALYRMFYQVPSWLFFLNIWNILVLAAYVMAYALFESAVILGFIVLLSLILPKKFFKDNFTALGSLIVLTMSIGAYLIQRKIGILYRLELEQLIIYPILILAAFVVLGVVFSFVLNRFNAAKRLVEAVADRMTIFAYIYIPLGLLSLVVVLARNIF
jgi:hypothetical protein